MACFPYVGEVFEEYRRKRHVHSRYAFVNARSTVRASIRQPGFWCRVLTDIEAPGQSLTNGTYGTDLNISWG